MKEEDDKKDPGSQVKFIDGKPVGSSVSYDADTDVVDGERYRTLGFDASEKARIRAGMVVPGTYKGSREQEFVNRLSEVGEFNRLETEGPDPTYPDRTLARKVNAFGEDIGKTLVTTGMQAPTMKTDPATLDSRLLYDSIGNMFRDADANDPIRALAAESRAYDKSQGVTFSPSLTVATPADFAAFKKSVGHEAAIEAAKRIEELNVILTKEDISDASRVEFEKELKQEKSKLLYAALTPKNLVGNVGELPSDRNIMNEARGIEQIYSAVNSSATSFTKGVGGVLEIIGDENKWDYLSKQARKMQTRAALDLSGLPTFLSDYEDIDTSNPFSAVADTGSWFINNVAAMVPLFSGMAAGGAASLLGSPAFAAAGISVLPGAIYYIGGIYADQPDDRKDSLMAGTFGLTAAVLDRLSLSLVLGKQVGSVLTKKGTENLAKALVEKSGNTISLNVAREMAINATKKEIIAATSFSAAFAKSQKGIIDFATNAIYRIGTSGFGESLTETTQSALEMIGAAGQWNLDARFQRDFSKNLVQSFIAGGVIGGGFKTVSEAVYGAKLHAAIDKHEMTTKEFDDIQQAQAELRSRWEQENQGSDRQFNTFNVALDIENDAHDWSQGAPKDATEAPKMANKEGLINIVTSPFRLLKGHVSQMTGNLFDKNGNLLEYKAKISSLIGKLGVIPGDFYTSFKRRELGRLTELHTSSENLAKSLGLSVQEASSVVLDAVNNYWSKGEDLPTEHPYFRELTIYRNEMRQLSRAVKKLAAENNADPSQIDDDNALFRPSINVYELNKNKNEVVEKLTEALIKQEEALAKEENREANTSGTRRRATRIVDDLTSPDTIKIKNSSKILEEAGLFRDKQLNNIFEKDFFQSLEDIKQRIVSEAAANRFLGKNGANLFKLADKAYQAGEFKTPEEYQKYLQELKDFVDMAKGEYNTLESLPVLKNTNAFFSTMTMLAMLGKAGISGMVDLPFSLLGTRGEKVNDQLQLWSKNLFAEIGDDVFAHSNSFVNWSLSLVKLNNLAIKNKDQRLKATIDSLEKEILNTEFGSKEQNKLLDKIDKLYLENIGRTLFHSLGFSEQGFNTESRFEYADSSLRNVMSLFAKITGLKQTTDATRLAALSLASDSIASYVEAIRDLPKESLESGKDLTNFQMQSLKELQSFGVDIPTVVRYLKKRPNESMNLGRMYDLLVLKRQNKVGTFEADLDPDFERFVENIQTGIANMVDSNVPNPQIHNIPKYYNDPRFRIFTIMLRYIAAYQTSVLPRLYKDYIKNGNVGMRYSAFSVMVGALAVSALGQGLKDQLAYGEDSPYINGLFKNAQRTIYGSGLLGKGEVLVDAISPLYDRKTTSIYDAMNPANDRSTVAGWAYDTAKSNIAPVAWGDRFVRAGGAISEGNYEQAGKQLARAAPLIGSFPQTYDQLQELFSSLNKE